MAPDVKPNKSKNQLERGLSLFHQGDFAKAAEVLQEAIMEFPESYEALYNLACCYSMLGEKDKAFTYLHRAIHISPTCIDWAKEDREFDPIRDDPFFSQLIEEDQAGEEQSTEEPPAEETAAIEEAPELVQDIRSETEPQTQENAAPPLPEALAQDAQQKSSKANAQDEAESLPPCTHCGGLLEVQKRFRYNPAYSFALLGAGVVLSFLVVFNLIGLLGFPMVIWGLYRLVPTINEWVCQACGRRGAECGQPADQAPPSPPPVIPTV